VGKKIELIVFTIEEDVPVGSIVSDDILTHVASERSLAKDWLTLQENQVWQDL
jgi:hypothetical protein